MNAETAKQTSLIAILNQLGAKLDRKTNREAWYFSPFRNERTASFKVWLNTNTWYDHGEGIGGNVIDFVIRHYKCSFKEALKVMSEKHPSFSFHQQPINQAATYSSKVANERKKYKTTSVGNIMNGLLIQYARNERQLNISLVRKYCREVHYQLENGRAYYGIGFKNNSDGYAVRNKYAKVNLGTQSETTISRKSTGLMMFEGWIDFLSFLTLYPKKEYEYDFIVLNSTSRTNNLLKEQLKKLQEYKTIILCFDNDKAGNIATKKIQESLPKTTIDFRSHYTNYNDFNEFLVAVRSK